MNTELQQVTYLLSTRLARLEALKEMQAPNVIIMQEQRLVDEAIAKIKELTK